MGQCSPLWMLSQSSNTHLNTHTHTHTTNYSWKEINFQGFSFSFFFGLVCLTVASTPAKRDTLTHPVSYIFYNVPPIYYFFSWRIYYPPSLSPFSHAFPASTCSPFLFLSSVLIEIQLCNSLSEDTIDLSPSCMFEEHWAGKARRQEEKDEEERDDWRNRKRGKRAEKGEKWKKMSVWGG